jgi:hypothetical protein
MRISRRDLKKNDNRLLRTVRPPKDADSGENPNIKLEETANSKKYGPRFLIWLIVTPALGVPPPYQTHDFGPKRPGVRPRNHNLRLQLSGMLLPDTPDQRGSGLFCLQKPQAG